MLYLGIFLFVLILLLIFPVHTTLTLHIDEEALNFVMKVYMFKYIRVYKKTSETNNYIDKIKNLVKDIDLTEEEGKEEPRKKLRSNFSAILRRINVVVDTYCTNKERFTKLRLYTKRKLKLKKIDMSIKEGTGDAAETGMYYGIIWSFLGSISAFLSNFFELQFKNINIACDYNNKTFKAEINCIFSFSVANIIIVSIRLYYLIKKYKQNINKVLTGGGNNE